jgi:hypothetical protein
MLIGLLTVRLPVHGRVTSRTTQLHRRVLMDFLEGWLRYGGLRLPTGTSYYIPLMYIDLNFGPKCPVLCRAHHLLCTRSQPSPWPAMEILYYFIQFVCHVSPRASSNMRKKVTKPLKIACKNSFFAHKAHVVSGANVFVRCTQF